MFVTPFQNIHYGYQSYLKVLINVLKIILTLICNNKHTQRTTVHILHAGEC